MPRSRNIKYSFFTNDELAENAALGRLLFIGLWTLSDCSGNMEWRPKRIKAELLPYDDCDVEALAINLDKSGFIRFYSDGDSVFLNITNFLVHQNPHKNERDKGSSIPEFSEEGRQVIDFKGLTINRDKSGLDQDENGSDPADSLIPYPDSLILIPDPLILSAAEPTVVVQQDAPKKITKKFSKPNPEELVSHFESKGSNSNEAEKFFNYYESNGWKVGRNPMKNWKAASANWLKNNIQAPAASKPVGNSTAGATLNQLMDNDW